jgi:hypothetical protein
MHALHFGNAELYGLDETTADKKLLYLREQANDPDPAGS